MYYPPALDLELASTPVVACEDALKVRHVVYVGGLPWLERTPGVIIDLTDVTLAPDLRLLEVARNALQVERGWWHIVV